MTNLEEVTFPVGSFKEAAPHLRRPFSPGAVRWKVQSTSGDRGLIVGYLDARLVIERLNLVVPHLWFDSYERLDGTALRCSLTVDRITREDVGMGKDAKSLYSDALKRAAVKFGIGVSLYALKPLWLDAGEGKGKLKKTGGNKPTLIITPDTESWLRDTYAAWLKLEGRGASFGPPLDHGDDPEGSVGELADSEPEQQTLDPETLDVPRANEQVQEIERLYAELKAQNGRSPITKGKLDSMLAAANTNAELEQIAEHIRQKMEVKA
jgi:hypothetical protein